MGWICCQLGAREHYAVPRALHARGALTKLVTDFWSSPGSKFLRALPFSPKRDLRGRYHPDLADADVEGLNFSSLSFEVISRMRGRRGWAQIMARNRWFERQAAKRLATFDANAGQPTTLFAYSYAALELLKHGKKRGWSTVLGQIDPGPVGEKILAEEVAREPELAASWELAPPAYWDRWREECDVADRIVVNSEWSRRALEKSGALPGKIRVVPLAYERPTEAKAFLRTYPTQFNQQRPLRVLFLGQINLGKGVARLLKTIRLLENEPIEFQFVGPVQFSIPDNLQNNPRLRWFGAVSRSDVDTFYRSADVLIFPTLSDGFGLTQLEAQSWSLPVIASHSCGEVVKHGRNGLLLEELTAEAITGAVCRCLADPELLVQFAHNSGELKAFSLAKLGEALLESS